MTTRGSAPGRSPLARRPVRDVTPPSPHTDAELAAVLRLLRRMRVGSLVVGSSRDAVSRRTAGAVGKVWAERGGHVLDIVDWPEEAASWLRQARRFTAQSPDAWVVTGQVPGWVQMGRRLVHSTDWDPARTVATASLADTTVITAGGVGTFEGMQGVSRKGGTWEIARTGLVHHDDVSTPIRPASGGRR